MSSLFGSAGHSTDTVWCRRDRRMAAAAGTAYVVLWVTVRNGSGRDARLFAAVNHHTSGQLVLRVPQQLGTPWTLPMLALIAFWSRRPHLALCSALALPLEKAFEVGLKKLLRRRRPAEVDAQAEIHDDAPTEGPSCPSGHTAIATIAVLLSAPYLPETAVALGAVAAAGTGLVRVRQGAHFPLDAVGGVLLGATVTGVLRTLIGRPAHARP